MAWQDKRVGCVSPGLYGTAHEPNSTSIYPSGFWYAWAGSTTNLEAYLRLNEQYADEPAKVGIGILSFIGFPGLETLDSPFNLAVYSLPAGATARAPTFEAWFRLVDVDSGGALKYPLEAQMSLDYAYATLGPGQDVVDAFEKVTGCSRAQLLAGKDPSAKIGCNTDFMAALKTAGPSPYESSEPRETCITDFVEKYEGPRNAAALRAALFQCQDAGFLNTGVGLGYNTYANPFVCKPAGEQSVLERYTGREFVFPNRKLTDLPAFVDIPLELGKPKTRTYLLDGYC